MVIDWADADSLRHTIVWSLAVLGVLALLVMRIVRRLLLRLVLIGLIGALAAGLWLQRASLGDCVESCSCRLFGQQVAIPPRANPNCG